MCDVDPRLDQGRSLEISMTRVELVIMTLNLVGQGLLVLLSAYNVFLK